MLKKYLLLSGIVVVAVANAMHAVIPIVPHGTTIAYIEGIGKGIGYVVESGSSVQFYDCSDGFTIPANTVVTWDVVPARGRVVTGPINFNANGAQLKLKQNLVFAGSGRFTNAKNVPKNVVRDVGNSTAVAVLTINVHNITNFIKNATDTKGFEIAPFTEVTWDVQDVQVIGPIKFNANSSKLILNKNLSFAGAGRFTSNNGVTKDISRAVGNTTALVSLTIDATNVATFVRGFEITKLTTVTWNAPARITGPITVADNASTTSLVLNADLKLGGGGLLARDYYGQLTLNGYAVYNAQDVKILRSVTDSNFKNFINGFVLSDRSVCIWETIYPVKGSIVCGSDTQLILKEDLHLAEGASLSTSDGDAIIDIKSNGKAIVLDGDVVVDGPVYSPDDLIIRSSGCLLELGNKFNHFSVNGMLTIKNTRLKFDGTNSPSGIFDTSAVVMLDGVAIQCRGASNNVLCAPGVNLVIWNEVSVLSVGTRLSLFQGAGAQDGDVGAIAFVGANSVLRVGPGVALVGIINPLVKPTISMTDSTSILHLNGCNFDTGSMGLEVEGGTVLFENVVRIFNNNINNNPLKLSDTTTVRYLANAMVLVDGDIVCA